MMTLIVFLVITVMMNKLYLNKLIFINLEFKIDENNNF